MSATVIESDRRDPRDVARSRAFVIAYNADYFRQLGGDLAILCARYYEERAEANAREEVSARG